MTWQQCHDDNASNNALTMTMMLMTVKHQDADTTFTPDTSACKDALALTPTMMPMHVTMS